MYIQTTPAGASQCSSVAVIRTGTTGMARNRKPAQPVLLHIRACAGDCLTESSVCAGAGAGAATPLEKFPTSSGVFACKIPHKCKANHSHVRYPRASPVPSRRSPAAIVSAKLLEAHCGVYVNSEMVTCRRDMSALRCVRLPTAASRQFHKPPRQSGQYRR